MQERCDWDVVSAVQVHEFAIKPIKALLDSFPAILDNVTSEVLLRRVEDDFLRRGTWRLLDWEFACLALDVNGDFKRNCWFDTAHG